MGYDIKRFISKLYDEFKCTICCDIVEDPIEISSCEHIFCKQCIIKWMEHSNTCPIDRNVFDSSQLCDPSRFFRKLYLQLKLKCEFAAHGCQQVLTLEELNNHVLSCDFSPISRKCKNGCGAELVPNQTDDHNCVTYLLAIIDDNKKVIADLSGKFRKQIEENIKLKLVAVNGLASDEFRYKINSLKQQRIIKSSRIESLLLSFDRKLFYNTIPYNISAQSIGYGAENNSLKLDVQILDLLSDYLVDGAKVLDIGSGCGYLTACMALMTGSCGKVIGMEHCVQLTQLAQRIVESSFGDLLLPPRLRFVCADGREGNIREAPFDVILIEAALQEFPNDLVNQLKTGGRMIAAIGSGSNQKLETIDRLADGSIKREVHLYVSLKPLTDLLVQISSA